MSAENEDTFIVEGKLALPYQYFAGRLGSRFLIALRDEKKILGVHCEKCGKTSLPPRATCGHCHSDLSESLREVKDSGVVTGFTVVRYQEPHQPADPPYVLALIQLEGADTPIPHLVKGIPVDEMKVGLRVKAVFAEKTTSTIMDIDHFRPEQS